MPDRQDTQGATQDVTQEETIVDPLEILNQGVETWNAFRDATNRKAVSLAGADLSDRALHEINLMDVDLSGANLDGAQLIEAHMKRTKLDGASLREANLTRANAREARFTGAQAQGADFSVATLRNARFDGANLAGARLHRAYLRQAGLEGTDLTGTWMRFATLERARCRGADFSGADLRYASMVRTDLSGARMQDVHVYGVSAWQVRTDDTTIQDLIVARNPDEDKEPLRVPDLETAQLMAQLLDGDGLRGMLNTTTSKMVLILGSFSPGEKVVLDAMRSALRARGYAAIVFDFDRPDDRGFAETVVIMAGLSRFVIADFSNPKEVRHEVPTIRKQYKRVPIMPIALSGQRLPITMVDYLSDDEIARLIRYDDTDDLLAKLDDHVITPAEAEANRIADKIARAEAALRG